MKAAEPQTILLTGATQGIGLALATRLLRTPHRLILTAREQSLARFKEAGIVESERVRLRAMDVRDDAQRKAVVEEAALDWGGVDVLINNAALTYRAVVEHVRREERLAQMGVNFRAPMQLIQLVLPGMRAKRAGRIITLSSVGGMMAMPTMAVYSASKWALEGAHEALWYEVRPWGIHVSLVQPGFVHSSGFKRVLYTKDSDRSEHDDGDPYHAHYAHMAPFIAKLMARSRATPDSVARKILRTMSRRHPALRVPATADAWFFTALRRYLPRRIYHWILARGLPGVHEWGREEGGRD
jgi:short-subunit dehydrogenase